MPVLKRKPPKSTAYTYPEWARDEVDEFIERAGLLLSELQRRQLIELVLNTHDKAVKNTYGDR